MRAVARRSGANAPRVSFDELPIRTLEAIAIENIVEGTVGEVYGVVVAAWQSLHAIDPNLQSVMRRIARDESRHAALAFMIARWIEPRLNRAARNRVACARQRAIDDLAARIGHELDTPASMDFGFPTVQQARALLAAVSNNASSSGRLH
jgi:hypothetical protein